MTRQRWLNCVFILLGLWPFVCASQPRQDSALNAEAQESLDRGLSAANQREWPTAIRHFDRARQAAPSAAAPLFNLALAESQIPWRELRAICWFRAYLALEPNAPNAAAIRRQIMDLEVRAEANAGKLIEIVRSLVSKQPDGDAKPLVYLLANLGDIAQADRLAGTNITLRGVVISALIQAGQLPEAIRRINTTPSGDVKMSQYNELAKAQIAAGQFSEARASIQHLSGDQYLHVSTRLLLASALHESGDREAGVALIREVRSELDAKRRFPDHLLSKLADAYWRTNARQQAEQLVAESLNYLEFIPRSFTRVMQKVQISYAMSNMGNQAGAVKLMREAANDCDSLEGLNPCMAFSAFFREIGAGDEGARLIETTPTKTERERQLNEEQLRAHKRYQKHQEITEARTAASKAIRSPSATPQEKAAAWAGYIAAGLNDPVFTDYAALTRAMASAPASSSSDELVKQAENPARDLINAIIDIRMMQRAAATRDR
jgi:hypothetical protein